MPLREHKGAMTFMDSFIRDTLDMPPAEALEAAQRTLALLDADTKTAQRIRRAVAAMADCWAFEIEMVNEGPDAAA